MNSHPSKDETNEEASPLAEVAKSPEATAAYLAELQSHLLGIAENLAELSRETRVHCRGTHLAGDRWYHRRLRALPVEKALKDVLKHADGLTDGLENAAFRRNEFADQVKNLPEERKKKALEKERRKNPQPLQAAPQGPAQQDAQDRNSGYSDPTSIYDLGRESA
ncbi:hypothetical protein ACWCQP_45055 [Streptomyces chartreusis]